MKINDLAEKYDISIRAIRYYEEIGLLSSSRDDTNIREFSVPEIERLELILFFKNFNFKLNEIKNILSNLDINTIKTLFQNRITEINFEIHKLVNEKQILLTVLNIINSQDNTKLNVTEFIKEQIYFQKKNERLIQMNDNKNNIVIEIGENLIPLANEQEDGTLINSIKLMRLEIENQYNINVDLIRLRDNFETLSQNEYRILKNNNQVIYKTISGENSIQKSNCIISDLKNIILS